MPYNLLSSNDGKKIIGGVVQNITILFRTPLNATEGEEATRLLREADENFIFNGKAESFEGAPTKLTKDELKTFLAKATPAQRDDFVAPLASNGGWVGMKPLRKAYLGKHHSKSETSAGIAFAGIQGSMTKKLEGMSREGFWEGKFDKDESQYFYRIKPQYLPVVKEVLDELKAAP